ncbi:hypothetical protein LINPERPRIM_LOCUS21110 [Linum perenne]
MVSGCPESGDGQDFGKWRRLLLRLAGNGERMIEEEVGSVRK